MNGNRYQVNSLLKELTHDPKNLELQEKIQDKNTQAISKDKIEPLDLSKLKMPRKK